MDFPLYCLAASELPRWLDSVDGQLGDPPCGLWLRHGTRPALTPHEPWARVGSLPRERHAQTMTSPGGDPVREVAFAATFALVNVTYPGPSGRPDDFARRIVAFAGREADRYPAWTTVSWTVGSDTVPARILELAGAWAGFTTTLPEVDVVVVAAGLDPTALVLAEDPSAYDLDVARPHELAQVAEQGRAAALGPLTAAEPHERWPLLPDHLRAIS